MMILSQVMEPQISNTTSESVQHSDIANGYTVKCSSVEYEAIGKLKTQEALFNLGKQHAAMDQYKQDKANRISILVDLVKAKPAVDSRTSFTKSVDQYFCKVQELIIELTKVLNSKDKKIHEQDDMYQELSELYDNTISTHDNAVAKANEAETELISMKKSGITADRIIGLRSKCISKNKLISLLRVTLFFSNVLTCHVMYLGCQSGWSIYSAGLSLFNEMMRLGLGSGQIIAYVLWITYNVAKYMLDVLDNISATNVAIRWVIVVLVVMTTLGYVTRKKITKLF